MRVRRSGKPHQNSRSFWARALGVHVTDSHLQIQGARTTQEERDADAGTRRPGCCIVEIQGKVEAADGP